MYDSVNRVDAIETAMKDTTDIVHSLMLVFTGVIVVQLCVLLYRSLFLLLMLVIVLCSFLILIASDFF